MVHERESPPAAGPRAREWSPTRKLAAASVHALTAGGAVFGLLAIVAIGEGRFKPALGWMGLALLVDSVDGALARRVRVDRVLPGIDGPLLDNLVDYLNYVIVPAYFVLGAPLVPPHAALPAAALICLTSAFQFAQVDAKTSEHHFKGFPSYWNVVVFYLVMLRLSPATALAFIVLFAVLVFVPVRYVYPSRTRAYRALTVALTALWAASLVWIWLTYPDQSPVPVYASLAYVGYYMVLSLVVTARRMRRNSSA
jgi:phosphatidylcholine synthase